MQSKVILIAAMIAYVEARFGQENVPIAAISAVNGGAGGAAATIAGATISDLLGGANPCAKLTRADQIVTELGGGADAIAAAQGLVAAEKNTNPFANGNAQTVCSDASLPVTPELRGITPLIDPDVDVDGAAAALSAQTIAAPLNADGMSVFDLMEAAGLGDIIVATAAAGGAGGAAAGGAQGGANAGAAAGNANQGNANQGQQNNQNAGNQANNAGNADNAMDAAGNAQQGNQANNAGNADNAMGDAAGNAQQGNQQSQAQQGQGNQAAQNGNQNNANAGNNAQNGNAQQGNNNNNAAQNDQAADNGNGAADNANAGGAAAGGADFGLCTPTIIFEGGQNGRPADEFTFQIEDPLARGGQGEALNPNIITNALCNQLTNVCEANDAAITQCEAAAADVEAAGTRDQTTADLFNAAVSGGAARKMRRGLRA